MRAFLCRCWSVIAACAIAGAALAARPGDAPGDYSHVLPLGIGGSQAVVQLPLPRAVYLAAQSPELHDLRVFDATGASMPFALADLAPPAAEKRSAAPVAIFPLHGSSRDTEQGPESLQIRTRSDGAVISVTTPARSAGDVLVSLILDLRPVSAASA